MFITTAPFSPFLTRDNCPMPTELGVGWGWWGQTAQGINIRLGHVSGYIHCGTLQTWLTYGYYIEYPPFPGPWLIGLFFLFFYSQTNPWSDWVHPQWHMGGPTHYGPPQAWLTLVTPHWIPGVSWALIGREVSTHLQTSSWSDQAENGCQTPRS